MAKAEYIEAGRIINTHGVSGEVKIEVWLDSPKFFRSFKSVYIDAREYKLLSSRTQKNFVLARLSEVEDINTAMQLKGKTLSIKRSDAALPHGAFFLQDIIGARVVDENGTELGILTNIMEKPASNIYVVTSVSDGKEHLIPAVPEFVLSTDVETGVVVVRLIEGM